MSLLGTDAALASWQNREDFETHINGVQQMIKSSAKKLLAISALAMAFPAQAAVTISYTGGVSPTPAGTTIIQDFESFSPLSSIGTNANVYTASVDGTAARPAFNSSGNFAAVLAGGTYNVLFGAPTSIFSFVLGSLDSYNELTLFFSSGGPLVLSGDQINNGPFEDGNQINANTNGRVTYTITGSTPLLTGASFRSSQNSFEFDNLAVAAVPEPATWLMMLLGFGAIGFSMRSKKPARRVQFA